MCDNKTFVAATYPRFGGLYYTVQFPDFDTRGKNIPCYDDIEAMTSDLQGIVDTWQREGRNLPLPKFKKYDKFESSYDDEVHYHDITVIVSAQRP